MTRTERYRLDAEAHTKANLYRQTLQDIRIILVEIDCDPQKNPVIRLIDTALEDNRLVVRL